MLSPEGLKPSFYILRNNTYMNTTTNFSINDPSIRKYFEGDNTSPPIRELVYIHTHPLVKPNFVDEISRLVNSTRKNMVDKNVHPSSKDISDIQDVCVRLGASIGTLDIVDPLLTLSILREVYTLCKRINNV